jgi:hypothetical protein
MKNEKMMKRMNWLFWICLGVATAIVAWGIYQAATTQSFINAHPMP